MSLHTTNHLARCPHCESTFEVSPEELDLALGAVRCGQCMKIFNANFHRVTPPTSDQQSATEDEQPAFHDPIPTLHEQYHEPESTAATPEAAEAMAAAEAVDEDWLDDELLAFEAELETALVEPEDSPDTPKPPALAAYDPDTEEINGEESDRLDEPAASDWVTETRAAPKPPTRDQGAQLASLMNYKNHLIALAAVVLVTLGGLLTWQLLPDSSSSPLEVSEVRISPASSPQLMQVHFQLTNLANEDLDLPAIQVELLNLSRQVIASQRVEASQVESEVDYLEAASRHHFSVEVERPSTYVQDARVQPLTP